MERFRPGEYVLIPAEIYAVHEYIGGRIEYTVNPMNCEPNESDNSLYDYTAKNIVGKWDPTTKEEA